MAQVYKLDQATIDGLLAEAAKHGEAKGWRNGFLSATLLLGLGVVVSWLLHLLW